LIAVLRNKQTNVSKLSIQKSNIFQLTGLTLSCLKSRLGHHEICTMRWLAGKARLACAFDCCLKKQTNKCIQKLSIQKSNLFQLTGLTLSCLKSRHGHHEICTMRWLAGKARLACAFDCKWKVESLNVENATYLRYAHR
jgi:hypothetical protein